MAYDYYRTSLPGWGRGSSQFQLGAPPMPAFQPQPSWTGLDFFSAHAANPDPSLYRSVMGGLGSYSGLGTDHRTARHRHHMIYSGLVQLTEQLPTDIGAAAAYEVYRTWKHNSSLYAPLSADRVMQREGLVGMAMGEATRLWQYTGRAMDAYGQRTACESAAATAAMLADRILSYIGGGGTAAFPSSPRISPYVSAAPLPYSGTYSASSASSYGGYTPAGSTVVVSRPRHRSHSRGRSDSRSDHGHHGHHHHHHHHGHHSDHHHHHRRPHSVEVISTGGGGYGYTPYYGGGGYGHGGTTGYGAGGATGYGGYDASGYPYSSTSPSGCVIA